MRTNKNLQGLIPAVSGVLTLSGGSTINIDNNDLVSGSFTIKDGTSDPSEFSVGGAVIRGCSFTLFNYSGKFSNINWFDSRVRFSLIYSDGTTLDMGSFYVVSHNETGYRISVETYSAMKLLDEYQIYEHSFTYPTTAQAAVTAIATARGLTVSGMAFPSMSIPDPGSDTITEREFVSYIAQMMGQFVTVDGNTLRFGWYDLTSIHDAGTAFSHNLRTDDVTITGVKVTTADGQTVKTTGTSGYVLNITNNPLINADNIDAVSAQMYNAVHDITFRPGNVAIKSDANIQAGDVLLVHTKTGNARVLATSITYKPTTRMSVTADAEPYDGDLRITRSQRIQAMMQGEADRAISKQLANSNSQLSKAIAGGGGGGGSVGGQNNKYGTLKQYNDTSLNEEGILLDKDGLTVHKEGAVTVEGRHQEYAGQSAYGVTEVVPVLLVKQGTHYFIVNDSSGVITQMLTAGHVAEDASGNPRTADMDSGVKLGQNLPVVAHAMVDIDALYPEDGTTRADVLRVFRVKHGQDTAVDVTVKPAHTNGMLSGEMTVDIMDGVVNAHREHAVSHSDYGGVVEDVDTVTEEASILGGLFRRYREKHYIKINGSVVEDTDETHYSMDEPLDSIALKDSDGNVHYVSVTTSGELVVN